MRLSTAREAPIAAKPSNNVQVKSAAFTGLISPSGKGERKRMMPGTDNTNSDKFSEVANTPMNTLACHSFFFYFWASFVVSSVMNLVVGQSNERHDK